MTITIQDEQVGSVTIVTISGRLDGAAAPEADSHLAKAVTSSSALALDLSGLNYVSSAGLRVFLKAAKQTKAAKKKLALACITPPVKEVFDISGFSDIFVITAEREGAVAAVS